MFCMIILGAKNNFNIMKIIALDGANMDIDLTSGEDLLEANKMSLEWSRGCEYSQMRSQKYFYLWLFLRYKIFR